MAKESTKQQRAQKRTRQKAQALLKDPRYLYRAMRKIGELGVVGEKNNRLILFLSGLTKDHGRRVSVLAKGGTGSGKSSVMGRATELFPPESVLTLASLSKKALVFGDEPLDGRILYIYEYRGMKDAQFLIRLQQSEGVTFHEYSTVAGRRRGTEVSRRTGFPVVWTSTTKDHVYADDETRFLSIGTDESPRQTLAIVKSEFKTVECTREPPLPVWHETIRLLGKYEKQVVFPEWFEYVASELPLGQVRVRRDWPRFLALCKVIARCRSLSDSKRHSKEIIFTFADYCVAHRILAPAFEVTVNELAKRELSIAKAVTKLHAELGYPVTVQEIARKLGWSKKLVYKYVRRAKEHSLVKYEGGTKPKNLKRLLPVPGSPKRFLPAPEHVFEENPQIGDVVSYMDPITGREITLKRADSLKKNRSHRRPHEK